MDLTKLDDLWNNLDFHSDSELITLYNHAISMKYKLQQTGDDLALEYWSDLAQMIICQRQERAVRV